MTVVSHRAVREWCCFLILLIVALPLRAQEQNACSRPNPESICNASNVCGTSGTPCLVDIKRTADSASVTGNTMDSKSNAPFCVKNGTTVTWRSLSKNTGFVVDFGASPPFDGMEAILGGSDRSPSVVTKRPGCYKFSTGACVSGASYGMCATVDTVLIVTKGK
jgi:plastocyanin